MERLSVVDSVLAALFAGARTLEDVKRVLKVSETEIRDALSRLKALGLVRSEIRGLLFKKRVYEIAGRGIPHAERVKERLLRAS